MKRWLGTFGFLFFIAVAFLFWVDRTYISPRQVGEDPIIGMTKMQILAKYGPPSDKSSSDDLWIYYRGMLGGGTGITFKSDVAVHVEMRGAQ